ncbi:MAG TPA: hypothetical protein VMX75_09260, partial [Spirochaetia bacterium]|nr:hypothetical protein [Spirochaetia bacterium]
MGNSPVLLRSRHWLILTFLVFFRAILLQGETITVLVPGSTSSMPLLLMGETDPIGGVDLKIEVFINHAQALARLIRGEAELLFSGTSQGWENYLSGGPLVHINTGVWGISYLIGRDESIRSVSDLRGKKIALPFPGSPL